MVVLMSAALQSLTGFGFAVLAVPLLMVLLHPRATVGLITVLSVLSVAVMWWRTRRQVRLPIIPHLVMAALVGLPFGLVAVSLLELNWLRLVVGVTILGVAVMFGVAASRPAPSDDSAPPLAWPRRATLFAGFASGFLTGCMNMPGPPVVALISGRHGSKATYRATLLAFFVVIYPIALIAMLANGFIDGYVLVGSLSHLPALLAGMWVGDLLHDSASPQVFLAISLLLLATAGLLCCWAGFSGLNTQWLHP
jgi:uncharacterized membrane protein YfcA